jgi:predicted DNA-binding transcriptional regulator YafY
LRSDRLVATLLILQRRGRVTPVELARELEVSEKTARGCHAERRLAGPTWRQGQGDGVTETGVEEQA